MDSKKDGHKDAKREKNTVAVLQLKLSGKAEEIGKDVFTDSDVDRTGFEKLLQQRDEVSSSSSGDSYPDDLSISLTSPDSSVGPQSGPKSGPRGSTFLPSGSLQQKSDNFSVSTHEATVGKGARPSLGPDFSSIQQKSDDEKLQHLTKLSVTGHHSGEGATGGGASIGRLDKVQEILNELSDDPVIAQKYTEFGTAIAQTTRELKTQKILIQTLEIENEKWKNTATEKIKECQQHIADKARLQQKIEKGEHEFTSSSLVAGSQFQDWVTVEKTQKALNTKEATLDELKIKLKENSTKLKEVMSANQRWDEYCEKIQQEGQIALDAMKREKEKFESLYTSQKIREEEKIQEVDKMILQVKKRAEALEREREDALHQLHFEGQKNNEFQAEMVEMKLQLKHSEEKLAKQREFIMTLQDSARSIMRPELQVMSRGDDETTPSIAVMDVKTLRDQVAVLRTQVMLTKEDFDIERSDRERIHAEKIALQQNYQENKQKLQAMQLQLHEKNREVQILSREKASLRADLNSAQHEMVRLKRELRIAQQQYSYPIGQTQIYDYPPHQLRPEFRQSYTPVGPPVRPPPVVPSGLTQQISYGRQASGEKWSCRQCTFQNVPERGSCEICGTQRAMPYIFLGQAGSRTFITSAPMDEMYYTSSQRLVPRGREECDSGQLKYSGGIETDTGSLGSKDITEDTVIE